MRKSLYFLMLMLPASAQAHDPTLDLDPPKAWVLPDLTTHVVPASQLQAERRLSSPPYPILAIRGHVQGNVRVRVQVGPEGFVLGALA